MPAFDNRDNDDQHSPDDRQTSDGDGGLDSHVNASDGVINVFEPDTPPAWISSDVWVDLERMA